jgi:ubiquinone/menaquinone biosynthesis C-methylase UbiE
MNKIKEYLRKNFNQKIVWDRIAFNYLKDKNLILDVGCGEGRFISQNPEKIIGLDWNEKSLKKCIEKGFKVVKSDVCYIPFDDESISGIHCSHVIEHLFPKDAHKMLSEFNRVLKNNGILIIRTPLMWKGFYSDFTHIKPYNPFAIVRYFSPSSQRTLENISENFMVLELKYRYQPLNFFNIKLINKLLRGLNKWGFPWIKKNGYMLVLKKGNENF